MPSKKPLSDNELEAWEASRDNRCGTGNIGAWKCWRVRALRYPSPPWCRQRMRSGLSQARFAALLGVSVRTLQEWEQGRRQPSGAAKTLIAIAQKRPEVLNELAGEDSVV